MRFVVPVRTAPLSARGFTFTETARFIFYSPPRFILAKYAECKIRCFDCSKACDSVAQGTFAALCSRPLRLVRSVLSPQTATPCPRLVTRSLWRPPTFPSLWICLVWALARGASYRPCFCVWLLSLASCSRGPSAPSRGGLAPFYGGALSRRADGPHPVDVFVHPSAAGHVVVPTSWLL